MTKSRNGAPRKWKKAEGMLLTMTAFTPSEPLSNFGCSESADDPDSEETALPSSSEPVDPAIGKGCAEALVKRGLIDQGHQSYAAALITHVSNDAIAATRELLRQAMIEKQNEAVVAEFIKRTVRRRAWGVERPVAVGRLAQNLHQRRAAAALGSRRLGQSENQ